MFWIISIPSIFAAININWFSVLFALTPPAAGSIVTFFLFKPILVRPPKPKPPFAVTPAEQPELFAFVAALFASVGAPATAAIALTLDVNASASLRRGWLSLLRQDLQLTIGLPLVGGLSLRQFTGVLAHEFGHFSQTAGLRSWFVIQNIRLWFSRVAYERDRWDEMLEAWQDDNQGWRTRTVFAVASIAVEASRGVLRLLLRAAGIVCAGFSRQMEFNADHFEAAMAGADSFEETTFDLPALQMAADQCWRELQFHWESNQLVDDFPRLVEDRWTRFDPGLRAGLRESVLAERADRYATHPSPQARIANVRNRNAPGIFALDGPASRLFRDYAGLCARLTESHYAGALPEVSNSAERISAESLAAAMDAEYGYVAALEAVLPGNRFLTSSFVLAPASGSGEPGDEIYRAALETLLESEAAVAILEAGIVMEGRTLDAARQEAAGARAALAAAVSELQRATGDVAAKLWRSAPRNESRLAYEALSEQQSAMLELRVLLAQRRTLRANSHLLPAAIAANHGPDGHLIVPVAPRNRKAPCHRPVPGPAVRKVQVFARGSWIAPRSWPNGCAVKSAITRKRRKSDPGPPRPARPTPDLAR